MTVTVIEFVTEFILDTLYTAVSKTVILLLDSSWLSLRSVRADRASPLSALWEMIAFVHQRCCSVIREVVGVESLSEKKCILGRGHICMA